ncbi:hypothetical protein FOBRF1_014116 [Fusarium oxysporum]
MGAGLRKSGDHEQRKERLLSLVNPVTLSQQELTLIVADSPFGNRDPPPETTRRNFRRNMKPTTSQVIFSEEMTRVGS